MSEEKTYRNFTAADIEKYHKGLLSAREMHDLEKAALDDPLLADALEGYAAVPINASLDIAELTQRLDDRVSGKVVQMHKPAKHFPTWLKAAAAVVLIGGSGLLIYKLGFDDGRKQELVQVDKVQPPTNSTYLMPADSTSGNKGDTIVVNAGIGSFSKATTPEVKLESTLIDSANYTTLNSSYSRLNVDIKPQTFSIDSLKETSTATSGYTLAIPKTEKRDNPVGNVSAPLNEVALQQKGKKSDNVRLDKKGNVITDDAKKQSRDSLTFGDYKFLDNIAKDKEASRANYFRGRVLDNNSNALPFANVLNTRDNIGTYADAQGYFTLLAPDSTLNVQVRSIGFADNNYLMRSTTGNQIVLQEDRNLAGVAPITLNMRKADSTRSRTENIKFEEPEPADGWTNYGTYLANNVKLSEEVKTRQVAGEVRLSFEVDKNGNPVKIKVEKSLCNKCDQEAVRLVQQGPKWKRKGKKSSRVTVSVPFESQK